MHLKEYSCKEYAKNEYIYTYVHVHTHTIPVPIYLHIAWKVREFWCVCVCGDGWQGTLGWREYTTQENWPKVEALNYKDLVNKWAIKVFPNYLLPVYIKKMWLISSLVLGTVVTSAHFLELVS